MLMTKDQEDNLDREIHNLLPWEPIVRACRNTFEYAFTPDPGDTCNH
jgi:hypothetical protein